MATECVICLDPMTPAAASRLACGHAFHAPCLRRWTDVSPTCPVCRGEADGPRLEAQRQRIRKLLHSARDPALFKVCSPRARALLQLAAGAPSNSSYQIAHHYASKSAQIMRRMTERRTPGDYYDWLEAAANMLAHLHMAGDTRASRAAGEQVVNLHETAAIAQRLSRWVEPAWASTHAPRYRTPLWRRLLCGDDTV